MKKFLEIIEDIKALKSLKQDRDVAIALGMKPNAFYNHKTRDTLPLDYLVDFCERESVSLDWLLLGRDSDDRVREINELKKLLKSVDKKLK